MSRITRYLGLVMLLGPAAVASASEAGAEQTEAPVSEARSERSPRVEWFWVKGAAGFQSLSLRTFDAGQDDFTIGFIPESKAGPSVDVALGARLLFVTLGARFTGGFFQDASRNGASAATSSGAWTASWASTCRSEHSNRTCKWPPATARSAAWATPSRAFAAASTSPASTRGWRSGSTITSTGAFPSACGAAVSFFLSRRGVPVRELLEPKQVDTLGELRTRLLEANGSTVGTALNLGGSLGIHF